MEYAKFYLPQMADFDLPSGGGFWVPANTIEHELQRLSYEQISRGESKKDNNNE
jgi:hypothetical protein